MSEPGVHRRLAAILAADVVGYSRLMGDDEAGTLAALRSHREALVEPEVAGHGGRIVKLMGDGLLAEFPSAVEAVRCAVRIQRAMVERNAEVPEARHVRFRIGINLGDVISEGGDIFGDGVNVAARLEELAEAGGICLSSAVHVQVQNKVDVGFQDLGDRELKNIAYPVHVFAVALEREPAPAPPPATPWPRRPAVQFSALVLAAVILLAGGYAWWLKLQSPDEAPASAEESAVAPPDKPAIAVLPFKNLSDDPEQAYFVDGITSDLVTDLSKFPSLRVASRSATAAYGDRPADVRQVGQDLNVQYVVEGSVEMAADRLRVTAQLIEVASGTQLWAQRFDRELVDLFAVREEIRAAIVGALTGYTGPLNTAEQKRATEKTPDLLTARDLYYRAFAHFTKFDEAANEEARVLLEKSIALDPGDADVHVLLAWVHWRKFWVFWAEDGEESLDIALEEARTAVELDRSDYRAHWVLGAALRVRGDTDTAMAEYQRAFELNPNDPDMLADWGEFLSYAGQPEQAAAHVEQAIALNPSYPDWYVAVLSRAYYNARQYDKAIQVGRRHVRDQLGTLEVLAASYAQLGRTDEAKAGVERLLERRPDYSIDVVVADNKSMEEGLLQHLVDGLRKAGLPER